MFWTFAQKQKFYSFNWKKTIHIQRKDTDLKIQFLVKVDEIFKKQN